MNRARATNGAERLGIGWRDAIETDALHRRLERDGVALIRGVLDPEGVARLRDVVGRHLADGGLRLDLGRVQPDAVAHVPGLEMLFTHPGIVALLRALIGNDHVVFTRHSDAHKNLASGWHKDSGA